MSKKNSEINYEGTTGRTVAGPWHIDGCGNKGINANAVYKTIIEEELEKTENLKIEDEEKSIERGLLFTRIVDFINDCSDISCTNKDTGELEALGVAMPSGVDIIHPLLTDYIEIWLDDEMLLRLNAQNPVLMAFKDLFEQIQEEQRIKIYHKETKIMKTNEFVNIDEVRNELINKRFEIIGIEPKGQAIYLQDDNNKIYAIDATAGAGGARICLLKADSKNNN